MTVSVWKGHHEPALMELIRAAWDTERLLVLCPPMLQDFSFLQAIPDGDLHIHGQWTLKERESLETTIRASSESRLPFRPVLGVFTSGTLSATPRLVMYSRENLLAALEPIFGLFDKSRIGHVFCYPQAFHTFGLTLGYVAAHLFGWKLHTPTGKYQRASHLERLKLEEPDVLTLGTPTHFFDLMSFMKGASFSIEPSYSCIVGGAAVSRSLWLRIQKELKVEAPSVGYGCTEASPGITHLAPGRVPSVDDEIGMPLSSLRSSIHREGVQIDGPGLCAAIVQNGMIEFPRRLTIRDRVSARPDGSWVYGGRLDLTLNRGGHKFSLEAIEKVLYERLGLNTVASSVRDTRLGEDLAVAIVAVPATERDATTRRAQGVLMEVFGVRLLTERVIYMDDFPMNECSKLDRRAVAKALERTGEASI